MTSLIKRSALSLGRTLVRQRVPSALPWRIRFQAHSIRTAKPLTPTPIQQARWSWLMRGSVLAGTSGGIVFAQLCLFESSYEPLPEFHGPRNGIALSYTSTNNDAGRKRIAVLGDSLVTGVGGDPLAGGPALPRLLAEFMSEKMGVDVEWHAFGKTGGNIEQLKNEVFPKLLRQIAQMQQEGQSFDAVVIICGLNDWKRIYTTYSTPQQFREELSQLISVLRRACNNEKLQVYLPALPVMWADFARPLKDIVCYVSCLWDREKKVLSEILPHVKFIAPPPSNMLDPRESYLASDGVHPNEAGYRTWSRHIAACMG